MTKYIASVQRYTFDFRFPTNTKTSKTFDEELAAIIKRNNITAMKKTKCDVTSDYEDETVLETCKNCGKEVRAYLLKPSFCMNCGNKIYPCSVCKTCTKCDEMNEL